jgi:hypothetical protein
MAMNTIFFLKRRKLDAREQRFKTSRYFSALCGLWRFRRRIAKVKKPAPRLTRRSALREISIRH